MTASLPHTASRPVRLGVIGCADIARRKVLPAVAGVEGVELAAVAARDPARARRVARSYGCRAAADYTALLADPGVDAVYIPLPAALHARWADAALHAGKHVLVEKPLAGGGAEAAGLYCTAAEHGLALMENMMFPFHRQHAAVSRLVEDGAIGRLRSLHAAFAVPPRPDDDIRYSPELGGGALSDTGVYPVRAAVYFLGAGLRVAGAILTAGPGRRVDTQGSVLLAAPNGVTATLDFGLDHVYRNHYALWGSEGVLRVERAFTPTAGHPATASLTTAEGTREIPLGADDQVRNTLAAFRDVVRGGRFRAHDVLEQARLLDAVREAARPAPPLLPRSSVQRPSSGRRDR